MLKARQRMTILFHRQKMKPENNHELFQPVSFHIHLHYSLSYIQTSRNQRMQSNLYMYLHCSYQGQYPCHKMQGRMFYRNSKIWHSSSSLVSQRGQMPSLLYNIQTMKWNQLEEHFVRFHLCHMPILSFLNYQMYPHF